MTGVVRNVQKKGLPQICIHAFSSPCGSIRLKSISTHSDGSFEINGLIPQSYYLLADASCRSPQNLINVWWNGENGTTQCHKAASISIQQGETKKHINFILTSGKEIFGKVIDQSGDPIPDVCIAATSYCAKQWFSGAHTNMNGQFSIQGLAANVVYLQINPQCSYNYHIKKNLWWAGTNRVTPKCQEAVSIALNKVSQISDIVFQIDIQPQIKGRILSKTHTPIANVCVNIKRFCANEWLDRTITDNQGFFCFDDTPEGNYYLQTSVSCQKPQKYLDFWWNSVGGDFSCKKAETIHASSQAHHFTLQTGNMIEGYVYDQNHQPLPNICVIAGNKCQLNSDKKVRTNEKGKYHLIVPDGQYFLTTDSNCSDQNYFVDLWWNSHNGTIDCQDAHPIQVSNNQTQKEVTFFLQKGGIMTGSVFSNKHTPLTDTCIFVTHECDQSLIFIDQTDKSGAFSKKLPQGTYFAKTDYDCIRQNKNEPDKIKIQPDFMNQWWQKDKKTSPLCRASDPIIIRSGVSSDSVDFILSQGGIISGRVMSFDGQVLSNIFIRVYDASGQNVVLSTYTQKNGQFRLRVPSGSYFIRAMPSKNRTPIFYIDQWWNAHTGSLHKQGAKQLVVSESQHKKNILFKLQKGGAVTGMVFTPEEYPIENIRIIASDPQKDIIWTTSKTNQYGQYVISGIPDGLQNVHFDQKSGHPYVLSHWTLGAVTEHQINIIPEKIIHVPAFILPEGGAISGRITTREGEALVDVCVTAVKKCGDICFGQSKTNDQGKYSIKGLPSGNYFVQTNISCKEFPEDYIDMYWRNNGGTPVCKNAETIHVQKNQTKGQVNFTLSKDVTFVGKITDSYGTPIEDVCVVISEECENRWIGEARSDHKGEFVITGISEGIYYAHTEASCIQNQAYEDLWWHSENSISDCAHAEPIEVVNSNMKVPINFELPEKAAQVFEPESHATLKNGQYKEIIEGGMVEINIRDNLLDLIVKSVSLENVLKVISKYTGIKVLLYGTLKDKIDFEKRQSKLDELLLDLINGQAGHIFIYSPDRLLTTYIFSKDGQLKATSLSANSGQHISPQKNPMSILNVDDIENILYAKGRVEDKLEALSQLIAYLSSENALKLLKISLNDSDDEVRMMAISVMNDLKENHLAVDDLSQSLSKDTSPAVRALAAESLGQIGDKSAIRPLMEALNDPDAGVRDIARRAIQEIQGR